MAKDADEMRPVVRALVIDGSPRSPKPDEAAEIDMYAIDFCGRVGDWPRGHHVLDCGDVLFIEP